MRSASGLERGVTQRYPDRSRSISSDTSGTERFSSIEKCVVYSSSPPGPDGWGEQSGQSRGSRWPWVQRLWTLLNQACAPTTPRIYQNQRWLYGTNPTQKGRSGELTS